MRHISYHIAVPLEVLLLRCIHVYSQYCTMHLHTSIHTCTSSGIKMRSLEILAYHFMNRQDHLNAKVHVLPIYHFIQGNTVPYMYMCVYAQ